MLGYITDEEADIVLQRAYNMQCPCCLTKSEGYGSPWKAIQPVAPKGRSPTRVPGMLVVVGVQCIKCGFIALFSLEV